MSGTQRAPPALRSQCSGSHIHGGRPQCPKSPELRTMPICHSTGTQLGARGRGQGQAEKLVATQPGKPVGQAPTRSLSVGSRPWGCGSLPAPGLPPHSHPCSRSARPLLRSDVGLSEEDSGRSLSWVWFWPRTHPDLDGSREVLSQSPHYLLPTTRGKTALQQPLSPS